MTDASDFQSAAATFRLPKPAANDAFSASPRKQAMSTKRSNSNLVFRDPAKAAEDQINKDFKKRSHEGVGNVQSLWNRQPSDKPQKKGSDSSDYGSEAEDEFVGDLPSGGPAILKKPAL